MKLLTNLTIKNRLFANAIVVATALSILFVIMLTNAATLNTLGLSLAKVEKLEAQVLVLRKHEKDFLARKDPKYVGKFQETVTELQKNILSVRDVADDFGFKVAEINDFEQAVKDYSIQFNQVSELQSKIGMSPKDGFYGELRSAVHDVEDGLKQSNSYHK